MGIRERILERFDQRQRIVFAVFFGIALLGNIALELFIIGTYSIQLLHLGLVFVIIQIVFNPQGIRLLFFGFLVFLLMKLFQLPFDSPFSNIYGYNHDQLLFGFITYFIEVSMKTTAYFHIAIYALLAYFALNDPFEKRQDEDATVIDDFQS